MVELRAYYRAGPRFCPMLHSMPPSSRAAPETCWPEWPVWAPTSVKATGEAKPEWPHQSDHSKIILTPLRLDEIHEGAERRG